MQSTQKEIWYEDENFWKTFAPAMFHKERLDSTAEEIGQIIELLGIEENAKILDLCCGIGRLLMDMAGEEVIARIWQERNWHEQDGRIFLHESKMAQNWSWAENKWIMLDNSKKEAIFTKAVYRF